MTLKTVGHYIRTHNWQGAIDAAKPYINSDKPDHKAKANLLTGIAYWHLKQTAVCNAYSTRVIDKTRYESVTSTRMIAIKIRSAETALAFFDIAVHTTPTCAQAHFYRGKCLNYLRKPQEAFNAYYKAASLDPTHIYFFKY